MKHITFIIWMLITVALAPLTLGFIMFNDEWLSLGDKILNNK